MHDNQSPHLKHHHALLARRQQPTVIFFAQGQNFKGIMMLAYGFGIIGLVDNLFRITLQKKIGDVHPLVTILGVIVGLNLFGFIGLIFGPLLISLFVLLVKIYTLEFNKDQAAATLSEPDS